MKNVYPFLFLACLFATRSFAQCNANQTKLVVQLMTDSYPTETTWDVKTLDGTTTVLSSAPTQGLTLYNDSVCLPNNTCYVFTIHDSYGDGICCGGGNGYFRVWLGGMLVDSGGQFQYSQSVTLNCPPGAACTNAIPAYTDTVYTAAGNNTWYSFVAPGTGMYNVTTCGLDVCDTKLWAYDHCANLIYNDQNLGTLAYNDDACNYQSNINTPLAAGQLYYIRVGSYNNTCTGTIDWKISGPIPVYGCMDPTACNYNPFATVDNGSCAYPGSGACDPDLVAVQADLQNSLSLDSIAPDNCQVIEGCLTGYGMRTIIRFSTHIQNIGPVPYFIGTPAANPNQFVWSACHNHWHYEGYAEYLLFDQTGYSEPVGFKNGFCVLDLECYNGGTATYSCGNMGISPGCGDIYNAGLPCQWIDITDVDTGRYTLVVRVNWNHKPDALGRTESNYNNNWAQACLHIFYNAQGKKTFSQVTGCTTFVDCAGDTMGSAQPDCNGVCNGTSIRGDWNSDLQLNATDLSSYMNATLNDSVATPCNDLYLDNRISIYDVTLLNDCMLYGVNYQTSNGAHHNYCHFPAGLYHFSDTTHFKIETVNKTDHYIDVSVRNPNNELNAYQFDVNGATVLNVVPLVDVQDYPALPQNSAHRVACYSFVDSSLSKSLVYQPLCRLYCSSIGDTVCLTNAEAVNQRNEKTATEISACAVTYTGIASITSASHLDLVPNPTAGNVHLHLMLPYAAPFTVQMLDALGRVVYESRHDATLVFNDDLDLSALPTGMYQVRAIGVNVHAVEKLILARE